MLRVRPLFFNMIDPPVVLAEALAVTVDPFVVVVESLQNSLSRIGLFTR